MSSGDLATWVGSLSIALTLVVTAWAVTLEAISRRHERLRGQAQSVAAWYGGGDGDGDRLSVANSSSLPIYEVLVSLVFVQGAGPTTIEEWVKFAESDSQGRPLEFGSAFTAIGPGEWSVRIPPSPGAMAVRPSCEIGFTDAAGRHWIRRGNGELQTIGRNAIDYYGLARPVDFQAPKRAG